MFSKSGVAMTSENRAERYALTSSGAPAISSSMVAQPSTTLTITERYSDQLHALNIGVGGIHRRSSSNC